MSLKSITCFSLNFIQFNNRLFILHTTAFLVVITSCYNSTNYNIPNKASLSSPSGLLSVGDVIKVNYPGAPELNQAIKIQADGKISLPMIGNVDASNRSASSLQSSLTEMYKNRINNPTVFVSLDKSAASVYVSGEVVLPSKVVLDRQITLLEAIMESGGFSKLANPKKVYVIRNEKGVQKRYAVNLADPLKGTESNAFYLRPYDVVFVERSRW